MSLKVLADENLSGAVVASLQKRGFNVAIVIPGASDSFIAEQAKQEERVIITHDSDFANILRFPPEDYFGIVRIKIDPPFNETVLPALERLFNAFNAAEDFRGKLIIVELYSLRVFPN